MCIIIANSILIALLRYMLSISFSIVIKIWCIFPAYLSLGRTALPASSERTIAPLRPGCGRRSHVALTTAAKFLYHGKGGGYKVLRVNGDYGYGMKSCEVLTLGLVAHHHHELDWIAACRRSTSSRSNGVPASCKARFWHRLMAITGP